MRVYEGLFLVTNQDANRDLDGCIKGICDLIVKNKGEIISANKWDERKLAYEIKRQKRGTYLLVCFTMVPARVADLERDLRLTESLLRHCVMADGDQVLACHRNPWLPCKGGQHPDAAKLERLESREGVRAEKAAAASSAGAV